MNNAHTALNPMGEICAIDFGSKNFKFVIGRQIGVDIEIDLLKKEPMGLGQDLLENDGAISQSKLDHLKEVLMDFQHYCLNRGVTTILGIGTSAIRSATNREQLTEIVNSCGISFEVAQGNREGEVAYLSVAKGAKNQFVTDFGSRSFQYAYKISDEVESCSLTSGYLIAYDQHFRKAATFTAGRKSFRSFLKKHVSNLPHSTDIYITLAGNSMAAFVVGGAKLDVVDQFLMQKQLLKKIKYLKKLNHHDFEIIRNNTPKIDKILPGLTFIEYMLELSQHDKVMIAEVELPAGLIVEHFLKNPEKK
jgi:exopolyphosphatase/pppGpp-phosphohydrolase